MASTDEAPFVRFAGASTPKMPTTSLPKPDVVQALKTGTTIVGVVCHDACVLAADTRATSGSTVADKRCFKLHPLAPHAAAAGAGTSADLDHVTRECYYAAQLQSRQRLSVGNGAVSTNTTEVAVSVHELCRYLRDHLYEKGGSCGANLIVGGVDSLTGDVVLRAIHPHGSMDAVKFTALGSGGLAAMAVLESRYRRDLSVDQAVELAVAAVKAGVENDLGRGSEIDVCIIRKTAGGTIETQYKHGYVPEESLPENGAPPPPPTEGGVNGFGNVPFSIRSIRVVQESRAKGEEERRVLLQEILEKTD
jgi:20S proteasome subunit beta 2